MRRTGGQPAVLRRARALADVPARMTEVIYADELIVGAISEKRIGAILFPEYIGARLLLELTNCGCANPTCWPACTRGRRPPSGTASVQP